MTDTHHHPARLPQLGQAVSRLLQAIAANPDYQRDGYVTYQSTSLGRWACGEHRCGNGAITTAESNGLIRIEAVGTTTRTLTLTGEGRRHVRASQARRLPEVLEGKVTTLAAIAAGPDENRSDIVTVEATVIALEEKTGAKTRRLYAFLTLEEAGSVVSAFIWPQVYKWLSGRFAVGDRVRCTGVLQWSVDNRPILQVQGLRKADA